MDKDTLLVLLCVACVVIILLGCWLAAIHVKIIGGQMALMVPPPDVPAAKPPRPVFLPVVRAAFKDSDYNYVAVADAPGHVILAWREWAGDGYKDKALDVLYVKTDGSVETLGNCVEHEVFGQTLDTPTEK